LRIKRLILLLQGIPVVQVECPRRLAEVFCFSLSLEHEPVERGLVFGDPGSHSIEAVVIERKNKHGKLLR